FRKGIAHTPHFLAAHTFDFNICHFPGCAQFEEPQLSVKVGHTPMHECHPRKIIQVPVLTRDEKTCGYDRWWPSWFVTIAMHVPTAILAIWIELQLKESRMDRGQQAAIRTYLPPGKGRHRNPAVRHVVKRTGLMPRGIRGDWWCQQLGDL